MSSKAKADLESLMKNAVHTADSPEQCWVCKIARDLRNMDMAIFGTGYLRANVVTQHVDHVPIEGLERYDVATDAESD